MDTVDTGRGRSPIGLILIVLLVIAVGWISRYILTDHMREPRVDTGEVRADIWYRVEERLMNSNGQRDGRLYAAACLSAFVRSEGSPRFGQANPHYKVAACNQRQSCDYVIVGVANGHAAIVTARANVPEITFLKDMVKDACVWTDVQTVLDVLGPGPIQPLQ